MPDEYLHRVVDAELDELLPALPVVALRRKGVGGSRHVCGAAVGSLPPYALPSADGGRHRSSSCDGLRHQGTDLRPGFILLIRQGRSCRTTPTIWIRCSEA